MAHQNGILRLPLPTANPEGLAVDDLVEYVGHAGYQVPPGERGIIEDVALDAREAPIRVTFEHSGARRCWPIELRRLAGREVAS